MQLKLAWPVAPLPEQVVESVSWVLKHEFGPPCSIVIVIDPVIVTRAVKEGDGVKVKTRVPSTSVPVQFAPGTVSVPVNVPVMVTGSVSVPVSLPE